LIIDPWFYFVAAPAVLIYGISKGGFGGGLGVMAVPLMALVISPVQAAAILLPILCLMDLFSVWAYRGKWIAAELKVIVLPSLFGVAAGAALFGYMSPAIIRLIIGTVALLFALHWLLRHQLQGQEIGNVATIYGVPAAATAGFTSFVAHAGGPPISMYLLRRSLNRTEFVATTAVFFTVLNYVKLVPYSWLGQFNTENLWTSLALSPLAPIGVGIGVWLHHRVSDSWFFIVVYGLLIVVGAKLIYDGVLTLAY
jgi:uncharacterized membrane protein YfcA